MREERKSRTVTSGTAGHDCARRPTPRPHGACRLIPERKVVQRASRGVAGSEAPLSPPRAGVAGAQAGTGSELPRSPETAMTYLERQRVELGKSVSLHADPVGRRGIKKKQS